jgi:uncharacterized RDD family membrane protein YckC
MGGNELVDVHNASPWQHRITIRTPENLELNFVLAGAGSRAAAYLLDLLLILFGAQLLSNLLASLLVLMSPQGEAWAVALAGLLTFAVFTGYFILFEWLMNGQTPGKRAVRIRVIKEGGYALQFVDSLLRNLMRVVDFLPLFYGVGLMSLLLTPRSQRLGDLAAGTWIVHREPIQTETLTPEILRTQPTGAPLPAAPLAQIPSEILESCVEFFGMVPDLAPRHRQRLALELVELVQRTSGLTCDRNHSAEGFLATVLSQSGQIAPWSSSSAEAAPPPS